MGQAPANIHSEIIATRNQMSATIQAIAERLAPKELANEALGRFHLGQSVLGLIREVRHEAGAQRKRQANGRGARN